MGHWGTCPLEFANARKFCRLMPDGFHFWMTFVTTNFGTRAPRARAPLEQILAMPVSEEGPYCERRAGTYNGGLKAEPQRGLGQSPWSGREAPEAEGEGLFV